MEKWNCIKYLLQLRPRRFKFPKLNDFYDILRLFQDLTLKTFPFDEMVNKGLDVWLNISFEGDLEKAHAEYKEHRKRGKLYFNW